jgi:hypothetical protein
MISVFTELSSLEKHVRTASFARFSVLTCALILRQKRKTVERHGVTLTATGKTRNRSGNTGMDFLFSLIVLFIHTALSRDVEPWVKVRF